MANQIPLSGATDAAGGYVLPEEQGDILVNAVLNEAAALSLAGDARATSVRKTTFPIWLGTPTAGFISEGGSKPTTGAEFSEGTITTQKVASIVLFTDEMLEDLQNGDVNVLIDSGVRTAIAQLIDGHALGVVSAASVTSSFDVALADTAQQVALGSGEDAFRTAVSAAMGSLEANGYTDPSQYGIVYGPGYRQHIRDARVVDGAGTTNQELYANSDPLYGIGRGVSSNLQNVSQSGTVAVVYNRANQHVRIRKDVEVSVSTEATVAGRNLFEDNLTAVRYETRLGQYIHDLDDAAVKIVKA
jgi:hypothetical protein